MTETTSLSVVIDGVLILQYDRNKPIPGLQRRYLEGMDERMDDGVPLGNGPVDNPDLMQRAQFVANSLVDALEQDNDDIAAAGCSWLATRLPNLKQVKVTNDADGTVIDLVFDQEHTNQVDVKVDLGLKH